MPEFNPKAEVKDVLLEPKGAQLTSKEQEVN